MKVAPVCTDYVHQTWPKVKDFLLAGILEGADTAHPNSVYNIDHVLGYLASGEWELVVGVDDDNIIRGAATVAYINYPLHRVAFVTALGGKLVCSRDTVSQLKEFLKLRGVTMMHAYGRESISRLWQRHNFKPRCTLLELQL
jgi:hypothetical protein